MTRRQKYLQGGFTLIEIIISLVLVAVVASMMFTYFGASFTQSGIPLSRLNTSMSLNQVIENITVKYNNPPNWRPNTAYASGDIVIPTTPNRNGFKYRCTSGGTTSLTNEPGWKMDATSVVDGSVTWQNNGTAPTLAALQTSIGTEGQDSSNAFGNYSVVQNRFIKFDTSNHEVNINGNPSDDQWGRCLKVQIGHASNAPNRTSETLTTLFIMR